MHPVLHPALSQVWRDTGTLQIGITPGRALVLGGLGPVEIAVLKAMNGLHDLSALRAVAIECGGDAASADRLVDTLLSAGAAVDGPAVPAETEPEQRQRRLEPDRASLALVERTSDAGAASMASRARRRVDVLGSGRVGAAIARLLAAAGIGEVCVDDPAPATPADVCPGGLGPRSTGAPRQRAVDDLIRADLPVPAALPGAGEPDLVVLAPVTGHGRELAQRLLAEGVAHLVVQVVEITGIVGPLVLPGISSCVRCHDLHRTDRDPGWPLVLDRSAQAPARVTPCDVALAAAVAGLAAMQVLNHLDGFGVAAVDGTIEVSLPHALPRRRTWSPHPACGCTWG